MKINGDNPNVQTGSTEPLGKVADVASATGSGKAHAAGPRADQLTLSPEAKIMQAAADNATSTPAIRQDVVERMRALLDKGAVGNDANSLAESIIDDWLKLP